MSQPTTTTETLDDLSSTEFRDGFRFECVGEKPPGEFYNVFVADSKDVFDGCALGCIYYINNDQFGKGWAIMHDDFQEVFDTVLDAAHYMNAGGGSE